MVLKPCVRLPTLQLSWSSASVAKTPCVPSIQKTQLPTDSPCRDGGFSAARGQREQVVGARRLYVAVRLDRRHAEACCGDESGKPPHDVRSVHPITQHCACARLQRIAIE